MSDGASSDSGVRTTKSFLQHRRILRFAHYAKLKIEARDRTSARTGLTAAESLTPEGGIELKKQPSEESLLYFLLFFSASAFLPNVE